MHRLLFIEDDDQIRLALRLALEDEGYEVEEAGTAAAAWPPSTARSPISSSLDLRLPDIQGFDVCRTMRAKSIVPIIIVTAQTDTYDLVAGLEAGADDYVTKPVVTKELAARIRALLRRVQLHEATAAKADACSATWSCAASRASCSSGARRCRSPRPSSSCCASSPTTPAWCSRRDQLLERVWGYDYLGDSRLVDAHIRRLRVKIEDQPDEPKLIVTVRGIGYRLQVA